MLVVRAGFRDADRMVNFRTAAADLIIGASCAGCGRSAITLCERCAEALAPQPHIAWPSPVPRSLIEPSPVIPIASGAHAKQLRSALACFKEEGQFGLLRPLGHLLAASICAGITSNRPVVLVPVPSSRRSIAKRGFDPIGILAKAAAVSIHKIGHGCHVERALTYKRKVADQSGLDARSREKNLQGAFLARQITELHDCHLVVVDDIITTGSTVGEACRALSRVGVRPSGIATIASTKRRR